MEHEFKIGDVVIAEEAIESDTGHYIDVVAVVTDIDKDGLITLEAEDDQYDLTGMTFEGWELSLFDNYREKANGE